MSNVLDDMRAAVNEARETLRAADSVSADMAMLLVGRLHKCQGHILTKLKRELRDWDMHRGKWKDRP